MVENISTNAVISLWHLIGETGDLASGLVELVDGQLSFDGNGRTLKIVDSVKRTPLLDKYGLASPMIQLGYSVNGPRPVDLELRQICNILRKQRGFYCQAYIETETGPREVYTSLGPVSVSI